VHRQQRDLNAKHPLWKNHRSNKNGEVLAEHIASGNCVAHFPDEPSYLSPAGITSNLDIFLSDLALGKPVTIHELSSDHYPVVCKLSTTATPAPVATRRDYHRVNWMAFSRLVDSRIPENPDLSTPEAIDSHLGAFEDALHSADERCIRQVPVRRQFVALDEETRRLIQQRNTVRRQFQRTGCLSKKAELAGLNAEIQQRMLVLRNENFARDIGRMENHSKPFWKVAKILRKRPSAIPPLKQDDGLLVSPPEKSNAIASKLIEAHNIGVGMPSPYEEAVRNTISRLESNEPFTGKVTSDEVRAAVRRGKNMKAPGDDGILNLVLKKNCRTGPSVFSLLFSPAASGSTTSPTGGRRGKLSLS
jgi:hypothetical protein